MTAPHPIVRALVAHRKRIGMTQASVGRRIHMAGSGMSMLESGQRRPAVDTLAAYAEVVGLRLTLVKVAE